MVLTLSRIAIPQQQFLVDGMHPQQEYVYEEEDYQCVPVVAPVPVDGCLALS